MGQKQFDHINGSSLIPRRASWQPSVVLEVGWSWARGLSFPIAGRTMFSLVNYDHMPRLPYMACNYSDFLSVVLIEKIHDDSCVRMVETNTQFCGSHFHGRLLHTKAQSCWSWVAYHRCGRWMWDSRWCFQRSRKVWGNLFFPIQNEGWSGTLWRGNWEMQGSFPTKQSPTAHPG